MENSGITTRRRRRKPVSDKENVSSNVHDNDEIVLEFRKAAKRVGATALYSKEVATTIVAASLGQPFGFLLANTIDDAVSTCRDIVKKAASDKGKLELVLHPLIVTVHVLRACWRLEHHRTNLVRLLYHATVIAADTLDTVQKPDPKLIIYGLGAWETLGTVLDGMQVEMGGKGSSVRCKSGDSVFPVPLYLETKDSRKCSEFQPRQFFNLGIHATMAAARIFAHCADAKIQPCSWCNQLDHCRSPEIVTGIVIDLVLEVILPWIRMLAKVSKDIAGLAKSARNVLWKLACKLKGDQMFLKSIAVESFLLHDRTRKSEVISRELLDEACRFAAQVADTSFSNMKRSKDNDVSERFRSIAVYHEHVGALLDAKVVPHIAPDSYLEYCGYRDLHSPTRCICSSGCWLHSLPTTFKHECVAVPATDAERIYGCFALGLAIRQHIKDSKQFDIEGERCEHLVDGCISSIERIPIKQRLQFFWLFSALDLHVVVRNAMDGGCTVNEDAQRSASRILSDCMGLLADAQGDKEKKNERLLNILVWSNIVAVAAVLPHEVDRLKLRRASNSIVSAPLRYRASYGKAISGIARSRHEQGVGGALEVMLEAIFALGNLEPHASNQLGNRLSFLASLYKDRGNIDEALFCTMTGLLCDIMEEEARDSDDRESELVILLSCHTKGLIPTNDSTLNIPKDKSGRVKEVVRLLGHEDLPNGDRDIGCHSPTALSLTGAIDLLLNRDDSQDFAERFRESTGTKFHFQTLLRSLFHDLNSSGQYFTSTLSLLSSVLVLIGNEIQREGQSSLIAIFKELLSYIDRRVGESHMGQSKREVILNLLRAATAVSLTSNSLPSDFTNWLRARHLDSERHVLVAHILTLPVAPRDNMNLADEWLQFGHCVWIATELFKTQLERNTVETDVVSNCDRLHSIQDKAKTIIEGAQGQELLPRLARLCALSVLFRLCDLFSFNGDDIDSIDAAGFARCHAVNDDILLRWLRSTTLSSQATDRIAQGRLLSKDCSTFSTGNAGAEVEACSFRLQACICGDDSVSSVRNKLDTMLRCTPDNRVDTLDLPCYLWTRTTILLGLAECHDREANMNAMLRVLFECLQECRILSKELKSIVFTGGKLPFSADMVARSMVVRCSQRRNDCLSKIALVYKNLSDHKLAVQYAVKLCRSLRLDSEVDKLLDQATDLRELVQHMVLHCNTKQGAVAGAALRLLLGIVSETKPFSDTFQASLNLSSLKEAVDGQSRVSVEVLRCVVEGLDLLNRGRTFPYTDTNGLLTASSHVLGAGSFDLHYPQIRYDFQLREAALKLGSDPSRSELKMLTSLCDLGASEDCTNTVRAGAFYTAGLRHLQNARESDELSLLWEASQGVPSAHIEKARQSFSSALRLVGSSCSTLKRNILRNFALSLGPSSNVDGHGYCSCTLIHASVGEASYRKSMRKRTVQGPQPKEEWWLRLFKVQNPERQNGFFEDLHRQFESNHRLVSIAACASGEVLMASIEFQSGQLAHRASCVFPVDSSSGVLDQSLLCFKKIMMRNTLQLQHVLEIEPTDRVEKKNWWRSRKELDEDLGSLLETFDRVLLQSCRFRDVVLGHNAGQNLAGRFEEVAESRTLPEIKTMKVAELVSELVAAGTERKALRGLKKAQLIDLLRKERMQYETGKPGFVADPILFLALDENLQRFPVEGIPSLQGMSICRLPSVAFALGSVNLPCPGIVEIPAIFDPGKTAYILDPESNLPETRQRIEPLINGYSDIFKGSWNGVVNETPSTEFLQTSLADRSGLMLYFGHGGGRKYFSGVGSDKLFSQSVSSGIVLMGCSSGQLRSSNDPGVEDEPVESTLLDPEGVALSYLAAGAPCVVGNLWDVTDKDIDAFSERMMAMMFLENESTAAAVAGARDACKLRYLTGAAPVCYGFPMRAGKIGRHTATPDDES